MKSGNFRSIGTPCIGNPFRVSLLQEPREIREVPSGKILRETLNHFSISIARSEFSHCLVNRLSFGHAKSMRQIAPRFSRDTSWAVHGAKAQNQISVSTVSLVSHRNTEISSRYLV